MANSTKSYKIIISGGGTGGHIYPAVAIADALKRQKPDIELLFVGAEGRMEMEKVPKAGYQIVGLPIRGLQRSLSLRNLGVPLRLLQSLWKANSLLSDFQADIAVGVGGYASAAVLQMAALKGVPVVIQEQNSYAGLTNKWLSRFATKIFVAYPDMEKFFPKQKIQLLGNPVRKDLENLEGIREEAFRFFGLDKNKKTILVIGGSLGARTINQSILENIEALLAQDYQIVWQTGKIYYENIKAKLEQIQSKNLIIKDFVYEMNYAYACADLVVSRAGALSVSELCLARKACILVPSPNVAEDHQTKNALALVNRNAAVLVKDSEAKANLLSEIGNILGNESLRKSLETNIFALAQTNAADKIASEILKIIE